MFNGFMNRLNEHHHTPSATKRVIIHTLMFIRGKTPDIVNKNFNQSLFPGPANDRLIKRPGKHRRKYGKYIYTHFENLNKSKEFLLSGSRKNFFMKLNFNVILSLRIKKTMSFCHL